MKRDTRPVRPANPGPSRGVDVNGLHAQRRRMSAEAAAAPAPSGRAPGHYAVYFTDEAGGIRVEYVHAERPGGES